jgi:hypothetical protein
MALIYKYSQTEEQTDATSKLQLPEFQGIDLSFVNECVLCDKLFVEGDEIIIMPFCQHPHHLHCSDFYVQKTNRCFECGINVYEDLRKKDRIQTFYKRGGPH